MLFKSLPSLPPSYSHDTVHSIHSLYDNSIFACTSENLLEQSQTQAPAPASTSNVPPLSPKRTVSKKALKDQLSSHSVNSNHSSMLTRRSSNAKKTLKYSDQAYNTSCSLDVEVSGDLHSLPSASNVPSPLEKTSSDANGHIKSTTNKYLDGLMDFYPKAENRLTSESQARHSEAVETNQIADSPLKKKTSQYPPNLAANQEQKVPFNMDTKEEATFKNIFYQLSIRLREFEAHMASYAECHHHVTKETWVHSFSADLLAFEHPTEKDVLDRMLKLVDHFQAQLDSVLYLKLSSHDPLSSKRPSFILKGKLGHKDRSSASSSIASFLSNSNMSVESMTEQDIEPICPSCLRLRSSLEAQTQALEKVDAEIKLYELSLSARLQHIEAALFTLTPLPIQPEAPAPLPFLSYLPNFERAVSKFLRNQAATVARLEGDLKASREAKEKVEAEWKIALQQLQHSMAILETELHETKLGLFQFKTHYEEQRGISRDLKVKLNWMKQLRHQLEQRAVEEAVRHKSAKKHHDQLQQRMKGLKDAEEQLKQELSMAKEYIKKQNLTIERQSRNLQLLKNKKVEADEPANSKTLIEECLQSLEAAKSKLSNEQKLRHRSEARLQGLKLKMEELQRQLDQKDTVSEEPEPAQKKPSRGKTEFPLSHHLLAQYKLAITDFIQWIYTLHLDSTSDIQSAAPLASPSSKATKTLVDHFSKKYLHMSFDELLHDLNKNRHDLPSKELASIFSCNKNVRQILCQFLKQCTSDVLQSLDCNLGYLNSIS